MKTIHIELDQEEVACIVTEHIKKLLGGHPFDPKCLNIQTKSKQNYRAEWERADYKAVYHEVVLPKR